MTVTLNLPADLQGTLLARAALNGGNVEDTIVSLLRDSIISTGASQRSPLSPQRLVPGFYPDEVAADDSAYQPVPLSLVGTVTAHLIPAGRLIPASFPDSE